MNILNPRQSFKNKTDHLILNVVQDIAKDLGVVKKEVVNLREDVVGLKKDVKFIKKQVKENTKQIKQNTQDIKEIKFELKDLTKIVSIQMNYNTRSISRIEQYLKLSPLPVTPLAK